MKIARDKDECGSGAFWKLDPLHQSTVFDTCFKERTQIRLKETPERVYTFEEDDEGAVDLLPLDESDIEVNGIAEVLNKIG